MEIWEFLFAILVVFFVLWMFGELVYYFFRYVIYEIIIYPIFDKIRLKIKNQYIDKINEIQRDYPFAYKEYVREKNISVHYAKISILREMAKRPMNIWRKEDEQIQEKEEKIIDASYDEIKRLYPNGLKKYNELFSYLSNKKTIVSDISRIKKYEQNFQEERKQKHIEQEREERHKTELDKKKNEQIERNRLEALSNFRKIASQTYLTILHDNGITCLYHFTDERNLQSIKEQGGLLSWAYCENNGIKIPMPGGGELSRRLDIKKGLQDYVRLSFTKNHPMMFIAKDEGRITTPVILEIDPEVITFETTKFSNKNATITRENVSIGNSIDDLKKIHFNTVKISKYFNLPEEEKSFFQAEVLVKTFIPIKYIRNVNSPLYIR